jgi:hypothetical protein
MNENKMEQVAKLLGQELGKRFTVSYFGTKFDCVFYKRTRGEIDFKVYDEPQFAFCFTEQILYALITGGAVILNE